MSTSVKKRKGDVQKSEKESAQNIVNRSESLSDGSDQDVENEPWTPGPYTVFKIIMSARLCAAAWNIVGDCDETYNYWEPTHYLMFGKGFQTWEYSPVYAIRSYAYIFLHTLPMHLYSAVFTPNPVMLFFFTRCVLAFCCAMSEVYFYKGVCKQFGNNVGRVTLCFLLLSAGMFISSTAYLPSSFCMYMTFLSLGGWFLGKYEVAIMSTAASAFIGWPFAAILGLPIAFDIVIRKRRVTLFTMWCAIALLTFLLPVVQLDQYFYGRLLLTPLNIVLYNVFTDHGPDLYGLAAGGYNAVVDDWRSSFGTEPMTYYFINGFLNFNVAFLLALISLPLAAAVSYWTKSGPKIPEYLTLLPMYIWIAIFFTRPHKEERFLFPIYPLFVLGGAVSVDAIQKVWSRLSYRRVASHYTDHCSWIAIIAAIFFSLMSVSRIVALYQAYHAPLDIYVELNKMAADPKVHTLSEDRSINVCVGKEWYRFPSSFFLPAPNWNLQFVQSEFKGQLPRPYNSEPHASRIIPDDVNDMNKEEPSRYVAANKCHYLVDLDVPRETKLEPRYSQNQDEWKILSSVPFLDASRSHRVFRAFYIPFISSRYCVYENYNLLKTTRTKKSSKPRSER